MASRCGRRGSGPTPCARARAPVTCPACLPRRWARIVYEFALGHHYAVLYREHLLRSLVPLYLGRTAAYVQATRTATAEPTEQALEEAALAFERQKPYLVEHWR